MSSKNILIWVIVGIIILVGIYLLTDKPAPISEIPRVVESGIKTYSSAEYGISFEYSSNYILVEQEAGTPEMPQKAILLVEDNQSNRDILSGKVGEVGEGPTSIAIDIFQNNKKLTTDAWVQENTNWIMQGKEKEPVTLGGKTGFIYFWDGLYAGKSSVITDNLQTYVFSVTWVTPHDQMLKDFQDILDSVKFSN